MFNQSLEKENSNLTLPSLTSHIPLIQATQGKHSSYGWGIEKLDIGSVKEVKYSVKKPEVKTRPCPHDPTRNCPLLWGVTSLEQIDDIIGFE